MSQWLIHITWSCTHSLARYARTHARTARTRTHAQHARTHARHTCTHDTHTHTDVCVTVSGVHAYQSTDCVHHCTPRVHLPAQCPDLLHGTLQIWSVHPFSFIYNTALPFPTPTHSEASQITPGAFELHMWTNTTKLIFLFSEVLQDITLINVSKVPTFPHCVSVSIYKVIYMEIHRNMVLLSGFRTQVCMDNTKVFAREQNWCKKTVKEAICIKHRAIVVNWNKGYHLPTISNQSIPSESEPCHVSSVCEQDPLFTSWHVVNLYGYIIILQIGGSLNDSISWWR